MIFRILLLICISASPLLSNAQTDSTCAGDLAQVRVLLEKTPSYQGQVKDQHKLYFDSLYQQLEVKTMNATGSFNCFCQIWKLFDAIKDNHLGFAEVQREYLPPAMFKDDAAVKEYRNSGLFKEFPKSYINRDSLHKALLKKPRESIEGIYYYDSFLRAGVYRTTEANVYYAVILESRVPSWEKGQIAFVLRQFAPNSFRAIYAHPVFKSFAMVKTEKLNNATLVESTFYSSLSTAPWKKFPHEIDHRNLPDNGPRFVFKNLSDSIQYMGLRTFQADPKTLAAAKLFYDSVKGQLTGKHLILDLRNNIGGAFKTSWQFLALVRNYALKNKVYVIINNKTISNGEQFVAELKRNETVRTFGESTLGMMAYGANYGNWEKLPSGRFMVYPTDMKDTGGYLRYEEKGIDPDVVLHLKNDWVVQVMACITSPSKDLNNTRKTR